MFPALLRAPRSIPKSFTRPALGVCFLLGVLAVPTLLQLFTAWRRNPDYDFAWFLAPLVVWLFVSSRPWECAESPKTLVGLLTLLAGGLLHLAAQVITWPLLDYAAWLLLGRGVLLGVWGQTAARRAMPVLLFSFFLFPLPLAWLNTFAIWMQDVISQAAAGVLGLIWVCYRQGNVIHLAGLETPLSVAVECSGVRQVLVFAALGSLLALFIHGTGRRLFLIGASLPVAVLANLLRVLLLAATARAAGETAIQGAFHDAPLLITLPLGGILLWWLYSKLKGQSGEFSHSATTVKPTYGPACLALALLAALQLALQVHLHAAVTTGTTADITLQALPETLGVWQGSPHPEAVKVAAQADFADETLTRVYTDGHSNVVAVYLVYSGTGRDREHHPEICLRDAGGAKELPQGRYEIPLEHGAAQRFAYQRNHSQRTTVYYWHYSILPERNDLSVLQFLYLRQQERLPSVSVQVQVNLVDPAVWQTIETTLIPELDRSLRGLLPASAKAGSDRLPIRFTVE